MKESKNSLNGFITLLSSSVGQSISRIGFIAILARLISPVDFGLMATALIVVGFAQLFVQLGFGQALIQQTSITQSDVSTAFFVSITLGIIIALILILISPFIGVFFNQENLASIVVWLSFLFPLKSFNQIQFSLIQKKKNFSALAGKELIAFIFGYGAVGTLFAYFEYGVFALVYGEVARVIIYTILLLSQYHEFEIIFSFSKNSYQKLIEFGKKMTIVRLINYFALKGDYFVIGKTLSVGELGFYSRAFGLMNFPHSMIGNVINTILFVEFSEIKNDKKRLTKVISTSLTFLFFIAAPISIFAFMMAPQIVNVLLGDQWNEVVTPFRILSLAIIFKIGYKITGTLIKGLARLKSYLIVQIVYFVSVFIGAYIGSYYGIQGVAIGSTIALIIMFVILLKLVIEYTFYRWLDFLKLSINSFLFTVLVVLAPAILYMLSNQLKISNLFELTIVGLSLIVSFVILILNRTLSFKLGYEPIRSIFKEVLLKKLVKLKR
ncbi:MAG: lipopolysaccharide biosynthesis protein [Flavobacteriaceae bacterium]|nr:lipopolysaccharide biosynthesis protein [Flavobacteriaceae bacterium]